MESLEDRLAALREKPDGTEGGSAWESAVEEFETRLTASATPPTHNGVGREVGSAGLAAASAAQRILTAHEKGLRTRYLKELVKELVHAGKCHACGAHSPTLRKDGYTKLFEKPLAAKYGGAGVVFPLCALSPCTASSPSSQTLVLTPPRLAALQVPEGERCDRGGAAHDVGGEQRQGRRGRYGGGRCAG